MDIDRIRAKRAEFFVMTARGQTYECKWLVEQVLCGEWEPFIEAGFLEELEVLLPVATGRRRQILKDGYLRYLFGEDIAKVTEFWRCEINMWDWRHGDRVAVRPLRRELVIIGPEDMGGNDGGD